MRNWSYIPDTGDVETCSLKGTNCRFPPAPGPLDIHVNLAQAMFHALLRRSLGCPLRSIGCAFARALKSGGPGATPGDDIALGIGERDYGIVKS